MPPETVVAGNPARIAMKLDEYVALIRRTDVQYDREAYASDPQQEVLRLFPRP